MKILKIASIFNTTLFLLYCSSLQGLAPKSNYSKFDSVRNALTQEAPILSRLNSFEWLAIVSELVIYKEVQATAWREIHKTGIGRERHQGDASRSYGVYFAKGDTATERALGNTITFEFDNLPFNEYDGDQAPSLSSFFYNSSGMAIAWRGLDMQRFPPRRIIVNSTNARILVSIKESIKKGNSIR